MLCLGLSAAWGETNLGPWKPAQPVAHLPRGAWWELFQDEELSRLERDATAHNQDLAAALSRLEQTRALVNVARADLFPQVATTPSFSRQRGSLNAASNRTTTVNAFSIPFDASWELDLWGRVRRNIESTRATLAATVDALESAKLALQAEVATDYFTLRALDAQAGLLEESIQTYQRSLGLTRDRRQSGIATELDVSQAQTQLESAKAQLPSVRLQRANLQHALATLSGQSATTFSISPSLPRPELNLPPIPVWLPSELLEHRPDYRGG